MSVMLIPMCIEVHGVRMELPTLDPTSLTGHQLSRRANWIGCRSRQATLQPECSMSVTLLHMCLFYILELPEALPANTYT